MIGSYDLQRKFIYVVDTLPSPPDSEEWPTLYIRGSEGIKDEVQRIERLTNGMLTYIGEWHSHPEGCGTQPSDDDRTLFAWIKDHLMMDGLPPLMAIAGEGAQIQWFLSEIP